MFPRLHVLDTLERVVASQRRPAFSEVAVVCVQHLLATTGSLFDSLQRLGVPSTAVYGTGKFYSTNLAVLHELQRRGFRMIAGTSPQNGENSSNALDRDARELWKTIRRTMQTSPYRSIAVLDDGGHCLRAMPPASDMNVAVVGVEQTTSGLPPTPALPVIDVAASAAKKLIESPMIAKAVLKKITARAFSTKARCGVVGLGNIGRALSQLLLANGHQVFVYDRLLTLRDSVSGTAWCSGGVEEVLQQADWTFGCTGNDILPHATLDVSGQKTLVSCSSEDREFRSFLMTVNGRPASYLDDIIVEMPRGSVTVLRGGYPINFDGGTHSVPAPDIQVTRGLLLGGFVQAVILDVPERIAGTAMLAPELQRIVVQAWFAQYPTRRSWYPRETVEGFKDLDWIAHHSSGIRTVSPV